MLSYVSPLQPHSHHNKADCPVARTPRSTDYLICLNGTPKHTGILEASSVVASNGCISSASGSGLLAEQGVHQLSTRERQASLVPPSSTSSDEATRSISGLKVSSSIHLADCRS
ncbi:unnamed protein product [Protopolystoma xenopodis]|uniref:Uncharacterized protein n=1 Tax=Protopolystoma xenopodis TaxID=117903 RepID=A0A3S5CJP9_9PLAT|nr:unnamed protein product [Protopolystoma xenopodis]